MSIQPHALACHARKNACHAYVTIAAVAVWVAGAVFGLQLLAVHALTPGAAQAAPGGWPAESELRLAPRGLTLLVFAHPYCPCLAASLEELHAARATSQAPLEVTIVFCRPPEAPAGWEQSEFWRTAEAQPGINVLCDRGGEEARRFGIETSGHTLLYAADGRLLFTGGITGARAHAGENAGRLALLSAADAPSGAEARAFATPVYGCPLFTACQLENDSCPR